MSAEAAAPPVSLCRECGLKARHHDQGECIDALRSLIADLEFQRRATHGRDAPGQASRARQPDRSALANISKFWRKLARLLKKGRDFEVPCGT